MTQILTIDIQDTPGTLGKVARCLAEADINIEAFAAEGPRVRLIASNAEKAMTALQKAGYRPHGQEVATVRLPNEPGSLATLAERLGEARVNIRSSFGDGTTGNLHLAVDNAKAATPVLQDYGPTRVTTK